MGRNILCSVLFLFFLIFPSDGWTGVLCVDGWRTIDTYNLMARCYSNTFFHSPPDSARCLESRADAMTRLTTRRNEAKEACDALIRTHAVPGRFTCGNIGNNYICTLNSFAFGPAYFYETSLRQTCFCQIECEGNHEE